ncbi:MAG: DNA-directed RNA polymerase subunit alpha [Candidatus Kapabacteria bacterium]|nr:DNA-directed RNA polymerase subunit alpha [Candidatus Kapabacteria bacterium]MDW8224687.1 DNA-directed RNA polymerase subunit alpha [Bacteroidota bacterium]
MTIAELLMPERILIDPSSTPHSAKFILQPLERGYGTTIGNALRRILLSSIPGAAIVGVRISGVLHEFQTIPGVVEDVVEILLNLKQVRLRMLMPERPVRIRLNLQGPGEWTAADIQRASAEIEVLNPELHIATLAEDAKLEVELRVLRGRGYVPAEEIVLDDAPVGMLPIDGLFSPIRQVALHVEPFRVGRRTDYDRLLLEVKTDGSITAYDAVRYAAQLLQQHLQLFFTLPTMVAAEGIPTTPTVTQTEEYIATTSVSRLLATPVDHLGVSARTLHRLLSLGIKTVSELVRWDPAELQRERGIGPRAIDEIQRALELYGLRLGMSPEELEEKAG